MLAAQEWDAFQREQLLRPPRLRLSTAPGVTLAVQDGGFSQGQSRALHASVHLVRILRSLLPDDLDIGGEYFLPGFDGCWLGEVVVSVRGWPVGVFTYSAGAGAFAEA